MALCFVVFHLPTVIIIIIIIFISLKLQTFMNEKILKNFENVPIGNVPIGNAFNNFASCSIPYFNSNLFSIENRIALTLNSFRMLSFIVSQIVFFTYYKRSKRVFLYSIDA